MIFLKVWMSLFAPLSKIRNLRVFNNNYLISINEFQFKANLVECKNLTPQPERNSFLFLALGELWEIKKVGVEDGNRRPNKK